MNRTDLSSRIVLWAAQGFGTGRIPWAPGTWGSLLGIPLTWMLLHYCGLAAAWIVTGLLILAAVPICGAAELILGRRDPGSVVLDEIAVMPLVSLPATTAVVLFQTPDWRAALLATSGKWYGSDVTFFAVGFLAFRLFDIWKPGPIRLSQRLAGGWGVVADDVLAALAASSLPLVLLAVIRR